MNRNARARRWALRTRRERGAAAFLAADLVSRLGLIIAAVLMAFAEHGAAGPGGHGYWIVALLTAVPRGGLVIHVDRGSEVR
ncbi:hypothetical protein [Spirillospora albida]|uniref:hypothetical protein n=1 Tax=Spirillospora albida TaxID=58123 RepID=UPI0004BED0AF|nr:hypothetical protein [Spirillospora albida]